MGYKEDAEALYAEVERTSAFVGLLIQHFADEAGNVRIPIGEVEAGLPENSGVHIEWDEEDLIFSIKSRDDMDA